MRALTVDSARGSERGVTLLFVCIALVALLGVLALAIDLSMLYVGRSEAQRAADAAALAGATAFAQSRCTAPGGDCSGDTVAQTAAYTQAKSVGDANYVLREPVDINTANCGTVNATGTLTCGDVAFYFPSGHANEPQVSVTVRRGGIPLIFAKIFNQGTATVLAKATAEATQASTVGCPVPFLLADCNTDPKPSSLQLQYNSNSPLTKCPSTTKSYFFDPNDISLYDTNAVGQPLLLHTGTSNGTIVPSQWYLAGITGTGSTSGSPSASLLRSNIAFCSQNAVTCGSNGVSIPAIPGAKVGPVNQGVDTLIGASGDGLNQGQDVLVSITSDGTPVIDSGTPGGGQIYPATDSKSVVTLPVYANVNNASPNTTLLSSGNQNTVSVVGFAQVFINYTTKPGSISSLPAPCDNPNQVGPGPYNDGPVCVTVLNLSPCPGNTVNGVSSPVPVRLVQSPTN